MELLISTEKNIENVALEVGYQDAFSFSKAFKKMAGVPPKEFRTKDLAERNLAYRF